MKKIWLFVATCSLLVTPATVLFAENQKGIDGVFLLVELETWDKTIRKMKLFGTVVDFQEMLEHRRQVKGPARRICEDNIDGFEYRFWIEPSPDFEKGNSFRFSVNQLKDGALLTSASGLVSTEMLRGPGALKALKVFSSGGGIPLFYIYVHAYTDAKYFSDVYKVGPYKELTCYYPTYKYPKYPQ